MTLPSQSPTPPAPTAHAALRHGAETVSSRPGSAVARALAFFLGGFSLLNIIGERQARGFDANDWWIDFRPWSPSVSQAVLLLSAMLLLAYALRPPRVEWRRHLTAAVLILLLLVTLANIVCFYYLAHSGVIRAGFPVPFSLWITIALLWILWHIPQAPPRLGFSGVAGFLMALAACLILFPLGQMLCFGQTDYRRKSDAIVVFGARVYADGGLSQAAEDRIATACRLYEKGYAPRLILSGGPGDGSVHETLAMRAYALARGIPDDAIIVDPNGLNTEATVRNTSHLCHDYHFGHLLAVSHFYHLPRIKLAYQRAGYEVCTVPAYSERTLRGLPKFMLREIAALWVYYLNPLT